MRMSIKNTQYLINIGSENIVKKKLNVAAVEHLLNQQSLICSTSNQNGGGKIEMFPLNQYYHGVHG